ncbi:hypothetical protein [Jiangella mangrovi]|uniref:Uncharacterized protein n=1 Tax=Jiangella mangrovi TaxID=1524084 RepID=A0A7W9GPL7_9ACTN|nr:hypothetical protein [Jiangella mangrovi]MBB5787730.1 hypothetical protein [Jiangella mangrovi]
MSGLGRGRARVARGLVMSAACLLLPTLAHVAAGGDVSTTPGFIVVALLLCGASVALADRRRSVAEIAAMLVFTQPVLHILLTFDGHHEAPVSAVPSSGMVVAHVLSAAALTLLLAGAENVTWSLAALSATVLLTRVRELLALPAPVASPVRVRDGGPVAAAPRGVMLVRSTPWRGPPALPALG